MKFKLDENFGTRTNNYFMLLGTKLKQSEAKSYRDVQTFIFLKYVVLNSAVLLHWIWIFQMLHVFRLPKPLV
jgi:hypothetical protein